MCTFSVRRNTSWAAGPNAASSRRPFATRSCSVLATASGPCFVNLLRHEVAVLSFLRRVRGQLALADATIHAVACAVDDAHRGAADLCDVSLLEKDKPARHGQQRRNVRGNEIFVDAEPYDHRTSLSRENQAVRIAFAHHGKRVGALEHGDHRSHRVE